MVADLQDLNESVLETLSTNYGAKIADDLIDLFLKYVPTKVADAVASEKSGDFVSVERAVHSIKSSAGNIGAEVLFQIADEIEQLISEHDNASIPPRMRQLEAAFAQLLPRLEMLRKKVAK